MQDACNKFVFELQLRITARRQIAQMRNENTVQQH